MRASVQQANARRNRSRRAKREDQMITAIVRFKLPAGIDAAKAAV
jgi:hypothetical protein